MMLRLYKFTCPGNYPVCKAVVIFATYQYLAGEEGLEYCAKIAESAGINKFSGCEGVDYLGTFMPHDEVGKLPYIIHAESGEY